MAYRVRLTMDSSIIAAIISAAASIIVALIAINNSHNKILSELEKHNAIQDTKMENLTEEVRKHNKLVERTYRLEADMAVIKSKVGNS